MPMEALCASLEDAARKKLHSL